MKTKENKKETLGQWSNRMCNENGPLVMFILFAAFSLGCFGIFTIFRSSPKEKEVIPPKYVEVVKEPTTAAVFDIKDIKSGQKVYKEFINRGKEIAFFKVDSNKVVYTCLPDTMELNVATNTIDVVTNVYQVHYIGFGKVEPLADKTGAQSDVKIGRRGKATLGFAMLKPGAPKGHTTKVVTTGKGKDAKKHLEIVPPAPEKPAKQPAKKPVKKAKKGK